MIYDYKLTTGTGIETDLPVRDEFVQFFGDNVLVLLQECGDVQTVGFSIIQRERGIGVGFCQRVGSRGCGVVAVISDTGS